jgi:hypothetical protein
VQLFVIIENVERKRNWNAGSPKNAVETIYVQNITDKVQDPLSNFLVIFFSSTTTFRTKVQG